MKTKLQLPTDTEDAHINTGITRDKDAPEQTGEDFHRMRPAADVVPGIVTAYRRTRGPQKAPTKKLVSLRIDGDVIDHFRATGEGWQGRINDALRKIADL